VMLPSPPRHESDMNRGARRAVRPEAAPFAASR
jgi:hypothetical protein